ncbi:hypothetical protein C5167_049235 [Papaver somniferum]|uniref:Uncharacterized protein n=1 Tax=Papaver somniferum TaxID=3469 RepID=A0A4Y7KLN3_PAPSO|nr:hypothetical protein C5167_049235 [Papaver somniferum]
MKKITTGEIALLPLILRPKKELWMLNMVYKSYGEGDEEMVKKTLQIHPWQVDTYFDVALLTSSDAFYHLLRTVGNYFVLFCTDLAFLGAPQKNWRDFFIPNL